MNEYENKTPCDMNPNSEDENGRINPERYNYEPTMNILVVEDNKGLNRLIQKTLQRENFQTEGAYTGEDAIAKVRNNQDILLLLDFVLPDINGKKVIKELTKIKCVVPFIVMTGQGDEKIAVEMMKLGARDYIIKDRNLLNILPQITKRVHKELKREMKLKTTEQALMDSEEKYSNLVEQAIDGVVIVQDEVFKFANNAMFILTGYNIGEIIGMPFLNLIAIDDKRLSEERKRLRMAGITGPSFYEAKIHCKNGTIRSVELSVSVINYNGKTANMGIIRDITERKLVEEALRESKEMYMTLVNTSPDAVTMTDLGGKITYASPRTLELHGYDNIDELFGKSAFELIAPEDREIAKTNLKKTMKEGIIRNLDYTLLKKDKTRFRGGLNATLIRDSFGRPKGFIATTRDITKQKQMEKDLKKYAEHLEKEVKKRTNELIQSEKMAALGQLVAGVAHEINNPLAYIKTNTKYFKEDLLDLKNKYNGEDMKLFIEMERLINTNIEGIKRIANITKTLKDFARPEEDGKTVSSINQGLRDTLIIVHNELKHRIKVHENYGDIPNIVCNIGQLNQVFMNLILNSSQAMNEGDIWIKTWSDENYVNIEIKDNGKGISDEIINKIFDPFFTTKTSGTGLGLSLSYQIIQSIGGDIKVKSRVGKGTMMRIRLPIMDN